MSDFLEQHARTKGKAKDAFEDSATNAGKSDDKSVADRAKQLTEEARLAADKQLAARDLKRQQAVPTLRPRQPGVVQAVHTQVRETEARKAHAKEQAKAKERIEALLKAKAEERMQRKKRTLEREP